MNAPFQRAVLLLHQERFADALRELEAAERLQPGNASIAELQAVSLTRLGRNEAALAAALRSVELDPESNPGHSVLARVHLERNDLRAAERALAEALRLDPEDAFDHGLLARIRFEQGRWEDAVAAADAGLVFEPGQQLCLHYRAVALVMAGRREEAKAALDALLAEAPDCAATHAAVGMSLIQAGDADAARAAFLEALRIDPESRDAREGLVTALRARHRLYGLLLRGLLSLGRFRSAGVWGLVLGGVLTLQAGRWLGGRGPEWVLPAFWLQAVVWTAVVFLVAAEPLFDLVLRATREGRLALPEERIRASNWNAVCLGVALLLGLLWASGGGSLISSAALAALMLTGAVRETFASQSTWVRRRMTWFTVGLALCLPGSVVLLLAGVAAGRAAGAGLLRAGLLLPLLPMLGAMVADNLREWLERRRPDPGDSGSGTIPPSS